MESCTYRCGPFSIDAANRIFRRGDTDVPVENKVLGVILQLLEKPAMLVTRYELLDAVWGHRYVTPSTLNRVIALARRAFGDDADEPRWIQTVHGAGYRYIGPVSRLTTSPERPPSEFAPSPAFRLPSRIDELIGRETDLVAIEAMLNEHRALTVLGAGGMGKTVCALEAARRMAPSYRNAVWFFDLAPMQTSAEWLRALAVAFSIDAPDGRDVIEKIGELLMGRRALFVLDNCDRIATSTGAVVFTLLRGTDELDVLSTSQQPLSFVGEQTMRLPPLELPAHDVTGQAGDVAAVVGAPACALLATRVRAVQPGFTVTPANAATIVEICRKLDGMPLALELAAARFALLSPEQVLERLTHRFQFLAAVVSGRDVRHRNLDALLEWSYAILSPAEQRFLTSLCVFVQGWNIDAAIKIAACLGHDARLAVDLLAGLANKSLVAVDSSTPPRYRLLESIREFALDRLRDSGEELEARDAHLKYVVSLCEDIERDTLAGRIYEHIDSVLQDDGNIEAALEHARSSPAGDTAALTIVGSLTLHMKSRGQYYTGIRWCDIALSCVKERFSRAAGRALLCKGVLATHATMRSEAELILATAASTAALHGDRWTEAYAYGYRALCLIHLGRFDEAADAAASALHLGETLEDPLLRGLACLARGWTLLARGMEREALQVLLDARNLGPDVQQHHFIDVYIGLVHYRLGEYGAAAHRALSALKTAAHYRNVRGMGGCIELCGYLAVHRGEYASAAEMLGAAARIRERTAVPLFRFWLSPHDASHRAAEAALGTAEYDRRIALGRQLREADAMERTASLLQWLVDGPAEGDRTLRSESR